MFKRKGIKWHLLMRKPCRLDIFLEHLLCKYSQMDKHHI